MKKKTSGLKLLSKKFCFLNTYQMIKRDFQKIIQYAIIKFKKKLYEFLLYILTSILVYQISTPKIGKE